MKLQSFSLVITRLRLKRKWSMPLLAERAGISKGLLYKIESSPEANPTIHTLQKISFALEVDIKALVS